MVNQNPEQQARDRIDACLKKAFSGQLAQQDPADKPVSELMVRIRANRAAPPRPTSPSGLLPPQGFQAASQA